MASEHFDEEIEEEEPVVDTPVCHGCGSQLPLDRDDFLCSKCRAETDAFIRRRQQQTTPLAVGDEEATIRSLFGENDDSGTNESANSGTNGGALDAAVEEAASTIKDSCMLELLKDRASREGWTEVEARQALRGLVELRKREFKEAARADIVNATPSIAEEEKFAPLVAATLEKGREIDPSDSKDEATASAFTDAATHDPTVAP